MEALELIDRIEKGEDGFTQLKLDFSNSGKISEEMVAFSNAQGGIIIIGVSDSGEIVGLTDERIRELNQIISNAANENVKPPIYPLTEITEIDNKKLIIIYIKEGDSKPYQTSGGFFYTKSAGDKRKLSTEELRRLFSESKRLYADEEIIQGTSIDDIDTGLFYEFLQKDNPDLLKDIENNNIDLKTVLNNVRILRDGQLTVMGNIVFGRIPQSFTPNFYIDCVNFDGNDVSADRFIRKLTVKGAVRSIYDKSIEFIKSNLRNLQTEEDFNSSPKSEIDLQAISEAVVNAIVHRDYFIQSSIKIFIFNNRLEIINPGKLPNKLTIEIIRNGISIQRNPILNSICKTVLPYSGYGSGVRRIIRLEPNVEFINNIEKEEFKCIFKRRNA